MNPIKPYTALCQDVRSILAGHHKTASAPNAEDPTDTGSAPRPKAKNSEPEKMGLPSELGAATDPIVAGITNGERRNNLPSGPVVDPDITDPTDPDAVSGATVKSAREAIFNAASRLRNVMEAPSSSHKQAQQSQQAVILESLGTDLLSKIAADLITSEEGARLLERHYTERFGAAQADEIVKSALALFPAENENQYIQDPFEMNKQANFFSYLANGAQAPSEANVEAFIHSLPPHVKQAAADLAETNAACISSLHNDIELQQFQQGQMDAIHIMKRAAAQEADPSIPMGGEDPDIEEIIASLMEMGMTEEQIVALLQQAAMEMQAGQSMPMGGQGM